MWAMQKLKFEIESVGEIIDINDTRFAKARLRAFASGDNRNNLPVPLASLKQAEKTIYGQPILWYYNSKTDDAGGHDLFEVPAGFVSTNPEEVNVSYELTEDGRMFFCFDALIWKMYSGPLLRIMERTDGFKKVSVEVLVGEYGEIDGKKSLEKFAYTGVTILGEDVTEAVPGACIELSKFEADKHDYEEKMGCRKEDQSDDSDDDDIEEFISKDKIGTGESIKINLSKESAHTGSWGNVNKTKLMNDLLEASNYKALVKACYLMVLDGWEEAPSQNLKYPVCAISNGELVLSIDGCQSALAYLEANKNDPNYSNAKSKLKKYYKKLDLDTENFEKEGEEVRFNKNEYAESFGITYQELFDKAYAAVRAMGENEGESEYWLNDFDANYFYVTQRESYEYYAFSYIMADEDFSIDKASKKAVMRVWQIIEDAEMASDVNFEAKEKAEAIEEMSNELKTIKEASVNEKTEMEDKIAESEAKFTEMQNELNSLKEFKLNIEKEQYSKEIEKVLNSVNKILSPDQIGDWRVKSSEYENVDAFAKDIKAFAFDINYKPEENFSTEEDTLNLGVNVQKRNDEDTNVFNRLENKNKG